MKIVESKPSVFSRIEVRAFAWAGDTWLREILKAIFDKKDVYHVFLNVAVALEGPHAVLTVNDWIVVENGDQLHVIWKRGRHMMIRTIKPFIDEGFDSHDDYSLTGMKLAILGSTFKERRGR